MTSRTILEFHGTTGWEVGELLRERVFENFGKWLPVWQVLVTETTSFVPDDLPEWWVFAPVSVPLPELYEHRYQLKIPDWMKQVPKPAWVDLRYGAAKLPVAAAIAFALYQEELEQWRQRAWEFLSDPSLLTTNLQRHDKRMDQLNPEDAFVILVGAAGGSTGHAGILDGVDFWSQHPSQPLIMVFAVGPHAGSSQDDFRTERANAFRLFKSLTQRQRDRGRIWIFWVDGFPSQRQQLLREVADFLLLLITRPEGRDLRRLLHDGFAIAQRRYEASICRLDVFRLQAPSDEIRRRAALLSLLKAIQDLIKLEQVHPVENSSPPEMRRLLNSVEACLFPAETLANALRSDNSLDNAVQVIVEMARTNLRERREQILETLANDLKNRSQASNLRGFLERLEILHQALEQQIGECLNEDAEEIKGELERKLSRAELLGYESHAATFRRQIVQLRARRELVGEKIMILEEALKIVQQWRDWGLRTFNFLMALAVHAQTLLQQLPQFDINSRVFNLDPNLFHSFLEFIKEAAKRRVGEYINNQHFEQDPKSVVERMCSELMTCVPPVALKGWFTEEEVASFLRQLPLWAGVEGYARHVFSLPKPFVVLEIPPNIPLPSETHSVTVFKNPQSNSLVARIFKHAPLEAIAGWNEWRDADEQIRQLFGGFIANSAEPFRQEEGERFERKPTELVFGGS